MARNDTTLNISKVCRVPGCGQPTTKRWGSRCTYHMNKHRLYGSDQAPRMPMAQLFACEREIRNGLRSLPTEHRSRLRKLVRERTALLLDHSEEHLGTIAEGGTHFHKYSGQVATWLRSLSNHERFRAWDFAIRLAAFYRLRDLQPSVFPTEMTFSVRLCSNILHLHYGIVPRQTLSHHSIRIMHRWLEQYMLAVVALMCRMAKHHATAIHRSGVEATELSREIFPSAAQEERRKLEEGPPLN